MSGSAIDRRSFLRGAAVVAMGSSGLLGATAARAHAGATAGAHPAALSADWATRWIRTVYDVVWRTGATPPEAARAYGAVALALYEAVVAGMPDHRSTAGQLTALPAFPRPSGRDRLDWPVTAAAAVVVVVDALFPTRSDAMRAMVDDRYAGVIAQRRAAGASQREVDNSLAHGRAVAAAINGWLAQDGYAGTVGRSYVPPTGESYWVSTPPNFGTAIEPYWHEIRPWVLQRPDEVEPAPHVPFSADPASAFGAQARATYSQSFVNTDEQRAIARFWTDNPLLSGLPAGHWLLIVSQVAEQHAWSLATTAEALARTGVALHDAFLSCWTWKYRLNLLRPVTYVQRYIDPQWQTFVNTPQFPEYTSGHSVASRAAATVLTDFAGAVGFLDDSHRDRNMPARSYASFLAAADEAAQSRLYGGIHYPMGIEAGKEQGDAVGALVVARLTTRVGRR